MDKKEKNHQETKKQEPVTVTKTESQSSVELSRSPKGLMVITVKVYDDDPTKAAKIASATFDALAKQYPYVE